jgi:CheY-like chemotaxis protein
MSQILIVDDDIGTLETFRAILGSVGHDVLTADTGASAVDALKRRTGLGLMVCDMKLPDMSGLDVLRIKREHRGDVPALMITGFGNTKDAVAAMRLGAVNFLEKPIFEEDLIREVGRALEPHRWTLASGPLDAREPHAAMRWARALVPIIESPNDPRTITAWSRWVAASPGALRNWCRTAGIPPRRSLVFIRILRAVCLAEGGRHKLENLLDVVDRRTLTGLLKLAGFHDEQDFPKNVEEYLERQALVRDPEALMEVSRAIGERHGRRGTNGASAR